MPRIVLSLLARDRAGIVKDLSDIALAHGANWLESRMTQLAGQFAGLVLLEAPQEQVEPLLKALRGFDPESAQILVSVGSGEEAAQTIEAIEILLDGADHPGIVHQLSELLANRGINIVELETDQRPAAMSGQAIFTARLSVLIPPALARDDLTQALDALADELTVDIRVV